MTTYQKFKALSIDHSAIGLEQSDTDVTYYCTPKDANIIGWAGVDGIHYCTIPEFGEMIFAVSPMNFGDCVHPIARNFEDLLRMLLFCADMAALEQCYAWDEEEFKAFLIDCPMTDKQKAVLDVVQKEFGIEPMADAFAYVKQLQSEFDLSKISYTEEYYDPDMNAAAPEQEKEWKVTFDGGFWGGDGKPGTEVPIGKHFHWGREKWYIPSVYICDEGLVMDYCMEAEPKEVKAFIDKWDLLNENRNHYTKEQQELPEHAFRDPSMEYPDRFLAISYSLEPDITGRGFMLQDCTDGDKPRRKQHSILEENTVFAAAIGVIGGADGPTAVIVGAHTPKLHAACSSLHFEAVETVEWRAVFSEKLMEDIEVCLL